MKKPFIAHIRKSDKAIQTVADHASGVSEKAGQLTSKLWAPKTGEILGLMHDFGKFSQKFQDYISSAEGLINPDLDEGWVDANKLKGKIDHSTAGAQWVYQWKNLDGFHQQKEICLQILAICIASHHSGLIDCLDADGNTVFKKRMMKEDKDSHLRECSEKAGSSILNQAQTLYLSGLVDELWSIVYTILKKPEQKPEPTNKVKEFQLGILTRFVFSALVDSDRMDSSDFEFPSNKELRSSHVPDWTIAIVRLENFFKKIEKKSEIDVVRCDISDKCKSRASESQGIYTLSVPTGGGKTLASLRFALHHAKKHQLERIIFIIPYTSIIEQNAKSVREIIEKEGDVRSWVLEHHSNLEPEKQNWQSKLCSENWDSPIIFTTMVQFLDTCFSGGTKSARRFHQLGKAVLIFDEVQTLPIKCVHMFCNTLNFLVDYAQTTALLCTATQPILNKVHQPKYGELKLCSDHELAGDYEELNKVFSKLERVSVINECDPQGWSINQIRDFVLSKFNATQSLLLIVNTKSWAQNLYVACKNTGIAQDSLFNLSTNQCAAHRKALLDGPCGIKRRLKSGLPVLCISTQLIEAGVDVSFACVVRFLAGLDSIAQAAGRCNRHGELADANGNLVKGKVYVIKPDNENTKMLHEIEIGKQCAQRVLNEIADGHHTNKLVSPKIIRTYFEYYFYNRKDQMIYPLDKKSGRNLLSLLSDNEGNIYNYKNDVRRKNRQGPLLMQSFMQAGKAFKAIDAPTHSVIVQIGRGRRLISKLLSIDPSYPEFYETLWETQKFCVNVFPNVWERLLQASAVQEIQNTGVYFLHESHYDQAFGLSVDDTGTMKFLGV